MLFNDVSYFGNIISLYKESNKMQLFICVYSKIWTLHVSKGYTLHHQEFTYMQLLVHIMLTVTSCSALPVGNVSLSATKSIWTGLGLKSGHETAKLCPVDKLPCRLPHDLS